MHSVFQEFLDTGITYNYLNGPNVISSEEQAKENGINCMGLMHLLFKRIFNVKLPSNLRVLEVFNDNPYFSEVDNLETIQMGDILFLGREELPEYIFQYKPRFNDKKELDNENEGTEFIGNKHAGYHLVMFVGKRNSDGTPKVIDIQKGTNKVKVWSLRELMENEKYNHLYKIKRIIV